MGVGAMTRPINKMRKIRSLDEFLTRGGQALSVYREQLLGAGSLPSDAEFVRHIKNSSFGRTPIVAETLWQSFYANGRNRFFESFRDRETSVAAYQAIFGEGGAKQFVDAAENIVAGSIDLLGLKGVFCGIDVDWHRDPVSERKSPLKHWKEFDELDATETGDKKVIWEFNRHQHFFTLGVAYWLTRDERYSQVFARHLASWIEQNQVGMGINWVSSLEVSFRAMSWIWAMHFFEESDALTPGLFMTALKSLYLHGRHIEQYLSKYYSPNTHLTGEALGLYYLGTQFPFFDRAKKWRRLGEDVLSAEIEKQVFSDGVYFEQSTWYQRYTTDFFAQFILLRELNGNLDGAKSEIKSVQDRLEAAFDLLMQITLPDGTTPLVGDDDGGRLLPLTTSASDDFRGSLALGALIFERGDMKTVAGKPSEEVFWLLGPSGVASYNALNASVPKLESTNFTDGGYSLMRDGWDETDNYMMIDCGELGSLSAGHGHADTLSIVAAAHGRQLLVDSGTYTYHQSPEMRDYFRSTTAHNTLVVDDVPSSLPGNKFSWRTRAKAAQKKWIANDRFDFFEGAHDGYERLDQPVTHTRSVLFVKGDYWIIRDLAETSGSHEYSLNFHFAEDRMPKIGDAGAWIGEADYRIVTIGDNGFWQQKEAFISRCHGVKSNAPFMRYLSSGDGTQEFFTFLIPIDRGQKPPEIEEAAIAGGRAFSLRHAGYVDVFVLNDEPGRIIDNGMFASNFRHSWARLREGEPAPDEFVLIDGDRLSVGGREVLKIEESEYASIRRFGPEYYIKTVHGRVKRNISHYATSERA